MSIVTASAFASLTTMNPRRRFLPAVGCFTQARNAVATAGRQLLRRAAGVGAESDAIAEATRPALPYGTPPIACRNRGAATWADAVATSPLCDYVARDENGTAATSAQIEASARFRS